MSSGRTIRRAAPDEADILTDITRRSKAHWGYSAEFMQRFWDDLRITPQQIRDNPVYVLEEGGRISGYYFLEHFQGETIILQNLFIDPSIIRSGAGAALWRHLLETAAALGCRMVTLESDPHAEGFYLKMGARRVGEHPAPIPGQPERVLPKMQVEL
jgi:GNAT superfamily N-acetyltransferase